jgi:uncharacterized protein (TIGR02145 family)
VDYDLSSAVASGTNNAGFSGLLAGYRHTAGTFYNRPTYGYWWSSSATGTSAIIRILTTGTRGVERNSYSIANSMSVRCLKD